MNIEIYEPTQEQAIQPISWNYKELKEQIETGLKHYENLVYTPENMSSAKKDRADLNRLSKAINDEKIRMKKRYLEPYTEFEEQAKELIGMIDKQSADIDRKIKEYENEEKAKKQEAIAVIYEEVMTDLKDLVPYAKIHNEKWLNKTTSLVKVREEIETLAEKIKTSFTAINSMGFDEPTTNRIKGVYLRNFDLAEAIAEKERIEAEAKRLAEYEARRKAEEEQRKAAEAQQQSEDKTADKPSDCPAEPPKEENRVNVPQQEETPLKTANEPLMKIDFRIWVTTEQLEALKQFLVSNKIKYGKVE